MGIFDGLPVPSDKTYLRDELARIDESWAVARFDSLPHVVHILTSKDRETDVLLLKEQSDVVEEVVDEVVHAYHGGFNKAIQNYSQILRLFSESTEKLGDLKHDLADAKRSLGTRNKQLHQLWYRSVTLRHIIALLDQIEGIAKVPSRIEKLIADKQFYAAIQVYLQSSLMLEREGLQTVGALQDVRSELTKLRGALFFKILDDLHAHLYNRGEYSSVASSIYERDDDVPTTTAVAASRMSSQPLSRRTRTLKGDSQFVVRGLTNGSHRTSSIEEGSSFDGHDEEDSVEHDEATDSKLLSHQLTPWLSDSTPDEFIEAVRKSDDPLHVKYLQTLVQCLCMLGKVAAAGAIICQKLRPTIHEIIISKIKAHMETRNLSKSACSQGDQTVAAGLHFIKGQPEAYRLSKEKPQNRISNSGTHLAVSPVSPLMVPGGKAQAAAKDLLDSILDTINFVKDHLLPTMFVDYRKGVQQAISSAAAFRPRAHTTTYTPTVEKGRPILQGLLAIDLLAKEVLGWAQAMPKFSTDLVKYVQTFLERTFERCRTSYMEAVLEKLSYRLIGRHDIEKLMRLDPASACLPALLGHSVSHSEAVGSDVELCELFLSLPSIKQDSLIRDDNKLILLASLSDSLEYVADSIERLGQAVPRAASQSEDNSRNQATSPRNLASFADEYRKLATDCLKVLRVEMQLETVFHLQEMTNREYLEDEDAEEPDDFVISLTSQITRRDEGMAPFISGEKRNYVFGGICGIAATASIKALAEMRSINLFGVQQICRNTIALEQAMAAIPYVDGESVQQNLDRVRTYFELLNMPFEALLAFIAEHDQMFTPTEYSNLLKVNVPGRDTPTDAQSLLSEILSH
ncbi:hypothetical protein BRARA_A03490 [Brassica rapa]|uniref:Exocyst complex component Sec8 n=1 Tax=Brassica campestris TaxID=3711 RepID=A0A398AZD0_BRACM|nr:hypothetical protein BRARA_A03490 [Brassica rapa]